MCFTIFPFVWTTYSFYLKIIGSSSIPTNFRISSRKRQGYLKGSPSQFYLLCVFSFSFGWQRFLRNVHSLVTKAYVILPCWDEWTKFRRKLIRRSTGWRFFNNDFNKLVNVFPSFTLIWWCIWKSPRSTLEQYQSQAPYITSVVVATRVSGNSLWLQKMSRIDKLYSRQGWHI